jgi:hypothetical protein
VTTKLVRTHVLLPSDIVEEIDRRAGPRRRSEYIAALLTEELKRRRRIELAESLVGSLTGKGPPAWETSESASDWVSELRRASDRYDAFGNPTDR